MFTRLPGDVMYFEQPQLAQWDLAKNNWRLDTFTDSQYNEGIHFTSFQLKEISKHD